MVCGESPQPHATVSQAIFQNGEERKVIKGKSISKATRLPKFHSDFPGARQQERRGRLALDPPLAPAQSPSALPGDAEGLSAFSGAWGGVQLRGFAQGSSRRHIPRTRGVPSAHPGRGASLPPSLAAPGRERTGEQHLPGGELWLPAPLRRLLLLAGSLIPAASFMLGLPLGRLLDQPHQAGESAGPGRWASSSWAQASPECDSAGEERHKLQHARRGSSFI